MKLIAIDLDGTLLSSHHEISEKNIETIIKAQENGHIPAICSGRPPESIEEILSAYQLNVPYAASNGTAVKAKEEIKIISSIDKHTVDEMVEILENHQIFYRVYTDHGVFVPENGNELLQVGIQKEQMKDANTEHIIKGTKIWRKQHNQLLVQKLFILFFDDMKRKLLMDQFQSFPSINVTASGPDNLEIMDKNGHKGNGLKALADSFHIPMEDTIAIGDNFNDVSMLEAAGFSIAMGNAEEKVKSLCDAVSITNDEDGVSYAIEQFVLKK